MKAYKSLEDYGLFLDGHVIDLKFAPISSESEISAFIAKVLTTQREKTYLKKTFYNLWIIMGKDLGEVRAAYCECIGK